MVAVVALRQLLGAHTCSWDNSWPNDHVERTLGSRVSTKSFLKIWLVEMQSCMPVTYLQSMLKNISSHKAGRKFELYPMTL